MQSVYFAVEILGMINKYGEICMNAQKSAAYATLIFY